MLISNMVSCAWWWSCAPLTLPLTNGVWFLVLASATRPAFKGCASWTLIGFVQEFIGLVNQGYCVCSPVAVGSPQWWHGVKHTGRNSTTSQRVWTIKDTANKSSVTYINLTSLQTTNIFPVNRMMSDTGLSGNVSMQTWQTWVLCVDRPLHTEHFWGALKCNYTPRIWLMCV